MGLRENITNPFSKWMDGNAPEADVVISSRVRLARNLASFPFPHQLSKEKANEIIHALQLAINNKKTRAAVGPMELARLAELTPVERQILVEKHLISPDLLKTREEETRALVVSGDEIVSIMVNEEDHLRLQCLLPGLQLEEAARICALLDDALEQTLDYAFSEKLGYLTACPTNVGTGMRVSVMVHLPGLVINGGIKELLAFIPKVGLTVRGLYGEGTEAAGNLFQISNQVTLGRSEEEIVSGLGTVTEQVIARERQARQQLYRYRRDALEDRVWRAYGTLRYARLLTGDETMKLLSDVRLGVNLGFLKGPTPRLLNELIVLTRPAYITKMAGKDVPPAYRDSLRAKLVREKLKDLPE
ncbi:MAG: protein arginine kinase [Peptococcaceae bacterium]|nr:protein arginine kinase [Peptococcaceae bacterium]